jgi:tetratricopeptide (TPR) repeat protein
MVVGRSGSGKSSLVYAGLLPALRRERDRFWNVLSLRPGPTPLRALAAAFNPCGDNEGAAEYAKRITKEADELRTGDPELLSHMTREQLDQAEGKPDRLLLYVDQWEELYAQAPSSSDKERAAQHAADVNRFINLLLNAAHVAPVTVVASVRADFYDPLIAHQKIRSLLPTQQILLGAMHRSELERTIVEPARKVGLAFDPPGLVQRILDEAGDDEGMLPLLQYALKETWALRKGNTITADSYARSGGVREAIRKTAERTFEGLSAEDQQAARQLFLRLVTPGEGQEDTRARAEMPLEPMQLKIVEQFAGPRTRLLVTGFDRARRPTVEVAHEALIRTWPRFRAWIDANREKLRARAAVLQAKADWEQNGKRGDVLLPAGLQLERARSLLADPGDIPIDDIKEFIRLSLKRTADEQRKRLRRNIALVVVSIFAVLAGWLYWTAEQQRRTAEQQRRMGEEQRMIAEEQRMRADDILQGATSIIVKLQSQMDSDTQKEAFALFLRGADHGDIDSMTNLGISYSNGIGVAQDYVKARDWYEKAADKGHARAMTGLGNLYANGLGVAQDYVKARDWFEKAAEKGDATAMTNLGIAFANGYGVAQDFSKAREWLAKAAGKGDATALSNLGSLYREGGQGVARDYEKAREWYEKAADKGDLRAKASLDELIQEVAGAGRYAEALALKEALAAKVEALETERKGKPGEQTAQDLNVVAWYALFAGEFTKALTVADRAHALLPNDLGIETNRAHALMFKDHEKEAKALYLAYKGKPLEGGQLWERAIAEDFEEFRKAGLTHPMMADIEKELGVSR